MAGDENYKISPAICTRVAIMVRRCVWRFQCCLITPTQREVYLSFPGGDFWDQVDKTLSSIKSMPEGTRFRCITSPFFVSVCSLCSPATSGQFYRVTVGHTVLRQVLLPQYPTAQPPTEMNR